MCRESGSPVRLAAKERSCPRHEDARSSGRKWRRKRVEWRTGVVGVIVGGWTGVVDVIGCEWAVFIGVV